MAEEDEEEGMTLRERRGKEGIEEVRRSVNEKMRTRIEKERRGS